MRKLVAAINMTLDGCCDHTAISPDEEIHDHYTDLLKNADTILYGRITYQLMQYWQTFLQHPSDEPSMNDFAAAIDNIHKIVFSNTLEKTDWDSATLATKPIEEEVKELKHQSGTDVLVGCRSLILQLMKLNLIDEYQICVHPVVAGGGLSLFDHTTDRTMFTLLKTKVFKSGAIILYYKRD